MARVLFINPPQNVHNKHSTSMYPSGALVLLATMAENDGHEVKIFDGIVDDEPIINVLMIYKPDYVVITVNTFQTKYAKEYLDVIKRYYPNTITIVGGPHISAIGMLKPDDFNIADYSVIGEGEYAVLKIINNEPLNDELSECYGNRFIYTRKQFDLDNIPLPNLDLVDLSKYTGIDGRRSMFIMASRGCPFKCTYCNKSIFGTKTRFRKPDKIIEEIKHLHDKYNINHIYFQDDTFNLNREWINEILNKIIDNGLKIDIEYMAPFRANEKLIDEDLLVLARKANLKTIFYGVESGNQEMLNNMKKGLNIQEIKRAFMMTRMKGLNTVAAFITGLPGEDHNTIKDTIKLWNELKPTYSGFTMATPFPNTEFDKYVTEHGHKLNSDWDEYRCGGSYIKTDKLSRNQLFFYNSVMIFGQGNEWIYKLPIYYIAKNLLLYNIAVIGIKLYNKVKE